MSKKRLTSLKANDILLVLSQKRACYNKENKKVLKKA